MEGQREREGEKKEGGGGVSGLFKALVLCIPQSLQEGEAHMHSENHTHTHTHRGSHISTACSPD